VLLVVLTGIYLRRNYKGIKAISFSNTFVTPAAIEIPPGVDFRSIKVSGVDVYVPTTDDRCFDHKIPCTPFPDTTLVLRANTLKSGFRHRPNKNARRSTVLD
jgi:hypothetical protein